MIAIRNAWGEKRSIPNSDSPELGTTFDTRGKTMKKVLLATTALALSAGVAYAEGVAVNGSAGMGLQYDGGVGATKSKTTELSYVSLSFGGTVETDGGLTLSASTTMKIKNNGEHANDGTTVSVSGAFGTLSMGSVTAADRQGGLADIGFDGIGIDNVAEALDGPHTHDARFDYAAGGLSFAVSAMVGGKGSYDVDPTAAVQAATKGSSYAIGAKYSFGSSYVGVGMASDDLMAGAPAAADGDTTSIYAGTSMDAFSINAMYSTFNSEDASKKDATAYGVNVAYTTGAATISFGYSDNNTVGHKAAYGVGASYDLGGGAAIKGGVGKVANGQNKTKTVADLGVSFSF
jgi:outer membrane protein OmpU